jgi:hypothetical protein
MSGVQPMSDGGGLLPGANISRVDGVVTMHFSRDVSSAVLSGSSDTSLIWATSTAAQLSYHNAERGAFRLQLDGASVAGGIGISVCKHHPATTTLQAPPCHHHPAKHHPATTTLQSTIQQSTIQQSTIQQSTIQLSTSQQSTIQQSTVLMTYSPGPCWPEPPWRYVTATAVCQRTTTQAYG